MEETDRSPRDGDAGGFFELLGVRHFAEVDPPTFYSLSDELWIASREAGHYCLAAVPGTLTVESFLDCLFVQADSMDLLVAYSLRLRRQLLSHNKGLIIRAILGPGRVFEKPVFMQLGTYESRRISVNHVGVARHGATARLKGAALSLILESAAQQSHAVQSLENASTALSTRDQAAGLPAEPRAARIIPIPVITRSRPVRFEIVPDLTLDHFTTSDPLLLNQIVDAITGSGALAWKTARLYVSLLANWARSVDLASPLAPSVAGTRADGAGIGSGSLPGRSSTLQLEIRLAELARFISKLPGLEVVHLTFLDRAFGDEAHSMDTARREYLVDYFKANSARWDRYIGRDPEFDVPKELVSPSARRGFARAVSVR